MKKIMVAFVAVLISLTAGCREVDNVSSESQAELSEEAIQEYRTNLSSICLDVGAKSDEVKKDLHVIERAVPALAKLESWYVSLEFDIKGSAIYDQYLSLYYILTHLSDSLSLPDTVLYKQDYEELVTTCSNLGADVSSFAASASRLLPSGKIDMKAKLQYFKDNPESTINLILKNKCAPSNSSAFNYVLEAMGKSFPGQLMVIHRGVVVAGVQVTDTITNSYFPGTLTEPFYYGVGPYGIGDEPWNCPESANYMTLEELIQAAN